MSALISARGLEVVHGATATSPGIRALAGVDVTITERDRVALLGRSGSGKSTLLHALGGLIDPSAGTVARAPGTTVGHVFQSPKLLPHLDAEENLLFASTTSPRDADASPVELLTLVGLGAKRRSLPADLSGGEAQRVALARALIQRPDVLLCDEPTGHLDSDTGRRVLDLVDALQEQRGFALVIATHDPAVAARLGRTVELRDGVVATAWQAA